MAQGDTQYAGRPAHPLLTIRPTRPRGFAELVEALRPYLPWKVAEDRALALLAAWPLTWVEIRDVLAEGHGRRISARCVADARAALRERRTA